MQKRWFGNEPALFCVVSRNDSLVGMFQEGEEWLDILLTFYQLIRYTIN